MSVKLKKCSKFVIVLNQTQYPTSTKFELTSEAVEVALNFETETQWRVMGSFVVLAEVVTIVNWR